MFYVYILRSINNPEQTYIGCTNNLKKRIDTYAPMELRWQANFCENLLQTSFQFNNIIINW